MSERSRLSDHDDVSHETTVTGWHESLGSETPAEKTGLNPAFARICSNHACVEIFMESRTEA